MNRVAMCIVGLLALAAVANAQATNATASPSDKKCWEYTEATCPSTCVKVTSNLTNVKCIEKCTGYSTQFDCPDAFNGLHQYCGWYGSCKPRCSFFSSSDCDTHTYCEKSNALLASSCDTKCSAFTVLNKCVDAHNCAWIDGECKLSGKAVAELVKGFFATIGKILLIIAIVIVLSIAACIYCCCCRTAKTTVVYQNQAMPTDSPMNAAPTPY